MADHQQVQREAAVRRDVAVQHPVGRRGPAALGHQPQAPGDPVDVGVHGHNRPAQREGQHAGRRLGADATEVGQVLHGLPVLHRRQMVEADLAPLVVEAVQQALDRRGLLAGQPPGTDGVLDGLPVGAADLLPARKPVPEPLPGTVAVGVGGVLAEDREDELVEGIAAGLGRRPVLLLEPLVDLPDPGRPVGVGVAGVGVLGRHAPPSVRRRSSSACPGPPGGRPGRA